MLNDWLRRAFTKTRINPQTGCWEYSGPLSKGYGKIHANGKNCRLHRLSFGFFKAPVPEEMLVCHKCDVPNCWNPDHLFIGTASDNNDDMVRKSRCTSRLTASEVVEIRTAYSLGERQVHLAERYGVSLSSINRIVRGSRWTCLTEAA